LAHAPSTIVTGQGFSVTGQRARVAASNDLARFRDGTTRESRTRMHSDDVALLEELLGRSGARKAAHALSSVDELCVLGVGALVARGIAEHDARTLLAAAELGRRASSAREDFRLESFPEPRAVWAWARHRLTSLDHEEMWLLALDGRNRLRAARRVGMGGLHGLGVSVRDVLRAALREGASAFIVVHNHPSGDPTPSAEDKTVTEQLERAAQSVDTPLLDHVVVAADGYASVLTGDSYARTRSGSRDSARAPPSETGRTIALP
jgi:DNA repair protein RadC